MMASYSVIVQSQLRSLLGPLEQSFFSRKLNNAIADSFSKCITEIRKLLLDALAGPNIVAKHLVKITRRQHQIQYTENDT